jgi:hypothetical protein
MRKALLFSAFVGVSLSACHSTGSPPSSTPTVRSPASPTPSLSGPCANSYFPVVEGASWTYARTSAGRSSPLRQSVATIAGAGFTILLRVPGGEEQDRWTCSPAGLANVGQTFSGPGGSPLPPGTTQFRHFRSHGVSVPSSPDVGSTWTQVVTSEARFVLKGTRHRERQVITTSYRAVGEESVTTPEGTYQALKVEIMSTTHKTSAGLGVDLTATTKTTQWWVAGVGVVRSIVDTGSGTPTLILLKTHDISTGTR